MDDDMRYAQELAKFGLAVREAREQRGFSERELANAVRGISLAGIRAIEAGERDLDYVRLIRLARALGTEPAALIVRTEGLSAE